MSATMTVELSDSFHTLLTDFAEKAGCQPEEVLQRWLQQTAERIADDPFQKWIGAFNSGVPGAAADHDRLLAEGILEEMRGDDRVG